MLKRFSKQNHKTTTFFSCHISITVVLRIQVSLVISMQISPRKVFAKYGSFLLGHRIYRVHTKYIQGAHKIYTGYTQKNGAVSKVNKKFISHLTRAQRTPSAAATVQVSHALITILQCVHPESHDTHPHGNQIHPRLGVACPL
jgi:hypothetical protein